MKPPLLTSTALETGSLTGLDQRARDIFRRIVETYLETGEPVGSRTLSLTGWPCRRPRSATPCRT